MTSGISLVPTISTNNYIRGLIVLTFITFGGFSVHLQVINNIKEENIEYKYFLLGRILQTSIALLLYITF